MSRNVPFTGARLSPEPAALWIFQSKLVQLTVASQRKQLFPPPGPLPVEWLMVEADIFNDDYIIFGANNATAVSGGSPPSNVGICTLSPGEWCCFEPNDKGDTTRGLLTAPDGDMVQLDLLDDLDMVDASQFWIQVGAATVTFCSVHVSIGNRSRR